VCCKEEKEREEEEVERLPACSRLSAEMASFVNEVISAPLRCRWRTRGEREEVALMGTTRGRGNMPAPRPRGVTPSAPRDHGGRKRH
jgi:hypothetical protein